MREFLRSDSPRRADVEAGLFKTYEGYRKTAIKEMLERGEAVKDNQDNVYIQVGDNLFTQVEELDAIDLNYRSQAINYDRVDQRFKDAFDSLVNSLYFMVESLKITEPKAFDSVAERMLYESIDDRVLDLSKLISYMADYLGITVENSNNPTYKFLFGGRKDNG